jgi:hypothetical protein
MPRKIQNRPEMVRRSIKEKPNPIKKIKAFSTTIYEHRKALSKIGLGLGAITLVATLGHKVSDNFEKTVQRNNNGIIVKVNDLPQVFPINLMTEFIQNLDKNKETESDIRLKGLLKSVPKEYQFYSENEVIGNEISGYRPSIKSKEELDQYLFKIDLKMKQIIANKQLTNSQVKFLLSQNQKQYQFSVNQINDPKDIRDIFGKFLLTNQIGFLEETKNGLEILGVK